MSESFICRRGGSGKVFAVIGVTYPEGSTCTCTDGKKTFTAKGTSGRATFIIPYAATWTVTCTNGEDTTSQDVSITTEGQTETVVLTYGTYLIDYNEYPNYNSWGWKDYAVNNNSPTSARGTATKGADGLTITGSDYNDFYGTDNIDLTEFSTLHVVFSLTSKSGWGGWFGVLNGTSVKWDSAFLAYISIKNAEVGDMQEVAIDLSSVTGSHKIGLGFKGDIDITFHQVWLT